MSDAEELEAMLDRHALAANVEFIRNRIRATDAENQRLRAEVEALREDCRKLLENEPVATCESCGTWLLDGDDYVTGPDGVAGCWASMTDVPSKTERKCYAYRVGKCDARTARHAAAERARERAAIVEWLRTDDRFKPYDGAEKSFAFTAALSAAIEAGEHLPDNAEAIARCE